MDNLARLRRVRTRVVKVQRRIWLLQAAFWLVVAVGCVLIATLVARLARRQRNAAASVNDFHGSFSRATGTHTASE